MIDSSASLETVVEGDFVVLEEPAAPMDGIIEPVEESKEGFLSASDVDVIPVAPLPARSAIG